VSIIFIILACSSPFMQTNIGEGKKSDPLALSRPPSWPTGPPVGPPVLHLGTRTRPMSPNESLPPTIGGSISLYSSNRQIELDYT
jgi:hypothetical protein